MRVLITVRRNPARRYLVHLYTPELIQEIRNLINHSRHSEAITTALSKGRFDRYVAEDEMPGIGADLILSESGACWDLTAQVGR